MEYLQIEVKNILLIYLHTFLSTFILFYICDTLFYIERGLSSSQYISFVGIAFLVKYGNVGNEIFEEIYYFCEQTEAGDFLAAIGIHDSEGVKNFT